MQLRSQLRSLVPGILRCRAVEYAGMDKGSPFYLTVHMDQTSRETTMSPKARFGLLPLMDICSS